MSSKHPKGDFGVLELRSNKEEFSPELVIHREMICRVQSPNAESELSWKEDFGLDDVSVSTPDIANVKQVGERMDSSTMTLSNLPCYINVETIAHVDNIRAKADACRMLNQGVLAEQVIAVDPGGQKTRAHLEATIDGCTLPPIRFAHPITQPGGIFLEDVDRVIRARCI
jgi:hypothetical protein